MQRMHFLSSSYPCAIVPAIRVRQAECSSRRTAIRMIKPLLVASCALIVSSFQPALAQPMTVETIIARHIEARGGDTAMRAIRSLVFDDGAYSENGQAEGAHSVMMLMRPYYKLVGHPQRRPDILEGYNGEAWEYYADPGIVL